MDRRGGGKVIPKGPASRMEEWRSGDRTMVTMTARGEREAKRKVGHGDGIVSCRVCHVGSLFLPWPCS